MQFSILILSAFSTIASAAHLSLRSGSLESISCGSDCLSSIGCTQDSIASFSNCINESCNVEDTSVAHTIEKFMNSCHSFRDQGLDTEALDDLKTMYISAQMTIMKRAAESLAVNGTANGNSSNSSNSSTNGTSASGTTSSASSTQKGTYATSCTSLGEVLGGECIVRSSDAERVARNSLLTFVGAAVLAALLF